MGGQGLQTGNGNRNWDKDVLVASFGRARIILYISLEVEWNGGSHVMSCRVVSCRVMSCSP